MKHLIDTKALDLLIDVFTRANALIEDVKERYPNEELRCPYMRDLDAAIKKHDEYWQHRLTSFEQTD